MSGTIRIMRGSDHFLKTGIKKLIARTPVEAFAIFLALACTQTSYASTGSSWSKSSWGGNSSDDSSSGSHKTVRARESVSSASDIAPYAPGSNNLALDVGQVFLMGDLNENYNDSLGTQLHYTYGVSDLFGFDSSLGYSEHSDGRFAMTTLLTGLRMNLSWYDKVIPYAVFGLGFYRPSYKDANASLSPAGTVSTSTNISAVLFGIHLGPGIDLEINKNLFFGAAITLHNMFGTTKVANNAPFNIGGSYTSFFVHIGASF
jgi:hypothetical protein